MARIPVKKPNHNSDNRNFKKSDSLGEAYRRMGPYLNIGTVWAVSVIFFTWMGIKLDERWDTAPWLTLAGAVLGVITGFYNFLKTVMKNNSGE